MLPHPVILMLCCASSLVCLELHLQFVSRSPKGIPRSPWAVKKINPKCKNTDLNEYQKRLNEEAKILKNLQHPNIVGKFEWEKGGLILIPASWRLAFLG